MTIMHDEGFIKFLQSMPATQQLLTDALRISERDNRPVEQVLSNVFEEYKRFDHMFLEDIEIDD